METVVQSGLSFIFHFKALYPHKSPAIGKTIAAIVTTTAAIVAGKAPISTTIAAIVAGKAPISTTKAAIVAGKAPISTTKAAIVTTTAAILKRTAREKKEVEKIRS
jgi:hypothetical protein